MFTYIDIFAGVGGLSEGFIRNGFVPLAHVEADQFACTTLKTRTAFYYLQEKDKLKIYRDYLHQVIDRDELYRQTPQSLLDQVINAEISSRTLEAIFKKIKNNMERCGVTQVDAIVGGPPCQPFSIVGRGALKANSTRETRANLYRFFAKFLEKFCPKIFVFENVPGLLSARNGDVLKKIRSSIDKAGYHLEVQTLDAHDFGVLQQRKRLILIGWKKGLDYEYPSFHKLANGFFVKDLLRDLPSLRPAEDGSKKGYTKCASQYLELKKLRGSDDVLTQHLTRPHNEKDREIYGIVIDTWKNEHKRLKYHNLPSRLKSRANENDFLDRYKVVADDISYCHTLLAHISKDGHYYIHPSRRQLRSLSVREAARIQSFPDNYYFEGPRSAAFRGIGNAVPPLMSEMIAAAIKEILK